MNTDTKYLGVQIDDKLQNGIAILNKSRLRHYELSVLLSMPINIFHQGFCRECIEELLSHISVIAARFGVVVAKLNSFQKSRIKLQK